MEYKRCIEARTQAHALRGEVTLPQPHFLLPTDCAVTLTHILTAVHTSATRWQSDSNLMLSFPSAILYALCFVKFVCTLVSTKIHWPEIFKFPNRK